ncbi:MAG: hypothetical protein GWP91_03225 [Rhodobacterales bacterium]|nr:hypothetical protein [Rhodobacterales bacterium]
MKYKIPQTWDGDLSRKMHARNPLHVVPTGDHSLVLTKAHTRTTGQTLADEDTTAMVSVSEIVAGLAQPQV